MNNVNLQEMEKFVSTIRQDPDQAKKQKRITGSWAFEQGAPQFAATIEYAQGEVVLNSELPPFAGGWGTSPDPIQYCLYGIAACYSAVFVATASSEGVGLTRLKVTAENWMDLSKQMGVGDGDIVEKCRLTVEAEGAAVDDLDRVMALTSKRCPGVECLTRPIPLEIELRT
ncbi:OsmC family protein [Chloroflexota bacterium]